MYTIVANGDNISSGINFYLVDTKDQLNNLYPRPGSKAYVIGESKTYILSHKKTQDRWIEYRHVLTQYVDDAIEQALNGFTGDIKLETIQQLISQEINKIQWADNEKFVQAVNDCIEQAFLQKSYVTKVEMDAAIAAAISGTIVPDLKDYLTKQEAADTYLTKAAAQNQFVTTADFDPDLIYVAGATIQDIK